ncbi:MAG: hypothetical protein FJ096_03970, partial [Deltaproteobacteria bacterium]|nr:hypothetical protein [Deltaproteobacteria bacterium]
METLASVVTRQGALPERDAVAWTLRLAKRVEALHRLGVSHGGLSAEAIRVAGTEPASRAVLADVREVPPQSGYRSPERPGLEGVSASDDAWAIGAMLFYLLTGTLPAAGQADAASGRAPNLPPLAVFGVDDDELQRMVDRFLAPVLAERTTRVAQMREVLEGWLVEPSDRSLPPLEESGGVGNRAMRDDDDEDNAATQMRDVGDIQALMAQMASAGPSPMAQARMVPAAQPSGPPTPPSSALPAFPASEPPAFSASAPPAPAGPPAARTGGPDPRRGTLLGFAAMAQPSAPPAVASVASPPSAERPAPPEQGRIIQPTMRSLGVPPMPSSSGPRQPGLMPPPAPMVRAAVDDDDDEDAGGSTLLIDAGPLDLSAAIEDALQRGGSVPAPAPAFTMSLAGPGSDPSRSSAGPGHPGPTASAVDLLLENPWQSAPPTASALPASAIVPSGPRVAQSPFGAAQSPFG